MLDGVLGRGFSGKCKSLIKAVRARLEVVRKRADAKQRYLKEDLTKLLSNGLDINAYGRTEEFLAGLNLLSCFDFIDQACVYILKQLSRMQKHGDCPDECRQAVASLMFAAARFSDLPELRDLRDLFEQKYGNCLDIFVNQKFVEKLSSSPFAAEKRLKVLQDIASEYSLKWDFRGFEKRMATPSVTSQVHLQKSHMVEQKLPNPDNKDRVGGVKDRLHSHVDSPDKPENREMSYAKREASSSHGDRNGVFAEKLYSPTLQKPKRHVDADYKPERLTNSSSHERSESREEANTDNNSSNNTSTCQVFQENYNGSKYAIPPPYIKSDRDIHRPSQQDSSQIKGHSIEEASQNGDNDDHDNQFHHGKIPLPKPRSIRRKSHKPPSGTSDRTEDGSDANSRRKDHSRKGLKLLFDEEHDRADQEEMMIDKLLIHYSKKPSTYDARKLKVKLSGSSGKDDDLCEPSSTARRSKEGKYSEAILLHPQPSRSVSLPSRQIDDEDSTEKRKVFARANSFEPAGVQAPHVHPKLPDYDDLAARFAALKGR